MLLSSLCYIHCSGFCFPSGEGMGHVRGKGCVEQDALLGKRSLRASLTPCCRGPLKRLARKIFPLFQQEVRRLSTTCFRSLQVKVDPGAFLLLWPAPSRPAGSPRLVDTAGRWTEQSAFGIYGNHTSGFLTGSTKEVHTRGWQPAPLKGCEDGVVSPVSAAQAGGPESSL